MNRTATATRSRDVPDEVLASGDCFTTVFSGLRGRSARTRRVTSDMEGAEVADLVARRISAVVTVRADPLGLRPSGEEAEQPGTQPHGAAEEPALQPSRDRVA